MSTTFARRTRWSCGSLRVRGRCRASPAGAVRRGWLCVRKVRPGEGGGDALLSFEPSNGVPARVLAGFAQPSSDELHELVTRCRRGWACGGRWVAVRPPISGRRPGSVRVTRHSLVPGLIAAQAIHSPDHRAFDRASAAVARSALGSVSSSILGDASADPMFPDLFAFAGARSGQSVGQCGQRGLEAPGEALDDAAFLGGTLLEKQRRRASPSTTCRSRRRAASGSTRRG